jgi:hypothetical protein
MIKFASIWEQPGDPAALDRWYRTTHSREAILFVGPWLRRYWAYRAYDAPAETDVLGASRYRLTEMWYASEAEMQEAQAAWYPLSQPPRLLGDPSRRRIAQIYVNAAADERFKDGWPRERTDYFRWVFFVADPAGVEPAVADRWFTEDFARPLAERPEVKRLVSARAATPPTPAQPWRRMCEAWFDDYDGFRAAVLEGTHRAPPWSAEFPHVPMISIFTGQAPDMDFLRDDYRAP